MKLQVIVNKLNRRKSPVTDFANKSNIVDVVKTGFVFESVAQIENNLGVWHQDSDGLWAWEKGLGEEGLQLGVVEPQVKWEFNADKMSWAHDSIKNGGLGIVDLWNLMGNRGDGVNVTIIDSGCGNKVPDLTNIVSQIYAPKDGGILEDEVGHGTLTAGVIGATGDSVVFGVAPKCSITMIKREGKDGLLSEAFDYAALCSVGKDVDILNISLEFVSDTQRIRDEVHRIAAQGTLIVAATQDGLSKLNDQIYPAIDSNVISVTALDKQGQLYFQALFNSNTKWILPGEQIMSCDQFGHVSFHDATSASAPFMSGLLALFISLRKNGLLSFTAGQLFEQLAITSRKVSFQSLGNTFVFNLPDPIMTYSNLKSIK